MQIDGYYDKWTDWFRKEVFQQEIHEIYSYMWPHIDTLTYGVSPIIKTKASENETFLFLFSANS